VGGINFLKQEGVRINFQKYGKKILISIIKIYNDLMD
jgi:hypothetical protein